MIAITVIHCFGVTARATLAATPCLIVSRLTERWFVWEAVERGFLEIILEEAKETRLTEYLARFSTMLFNSD